MSICFGFIISSLVFNILRIANISPNPCSKFVESFIKFTDLRSSLVVGGESLEDNFDALVGNPDMWGGSWMILEHTRYWNFHAMLSSYSRLLAFNIVLLFSVVATPGRLMHVIGLVKLSLNSCEFAVFDEADRYSKPLLYFAPIICTRSSFALTILRLFEMGFKTQINEILYKLSPRRQTLLFSATLPNVLVEFVRAGLKVCYLAASVAFSTRSEYLGSPLPSSWFRKQNPRHLDGTMGAWS